MVSYTDANAFGKGGHNVARVQQLVNQSVAKMVGVKDAREAFRSLFAPDDVVALKLNCLAGPKLSSSVSVVNAIVTNLRAIGIPFENIILFERSTVEMTRVGFPRDLVGKSGPRCYGNDEAGYHRELTFSGDIGSLFSNVVANQATAIINVPVLKDHDLSGVGCGMKNMFGVIHNPNKYHDNNCDPYVADVCAHPYVKQKLKLTVADGLTAQYHGGPAGNLTYQKREGRLLVSTDPVALDATAGQWIEEQRKRAGLASLTESKRAPRWLRTASKKGLGEHRLDRIELMER